ncbi:MAG: hypothetical protein IKY15_00215 [Clostridia bacterium]|nr:hypothetical protein [Clostridia bacterium]
MKANWNNKNSEWNIKVNATEFEILAKILYTLNCDSDWNDDLELECSIKFTSDEVKTLYGMSL